jgi:hypothetical protein
MTYADYQVAPRTGRPNETRSRQALESAGRNLEDSARLLAHPSPDYREALSRSLRSIRQSYVALLEWHGLTPETDGPISRLGRPAEGLSSMLRTCLEHTLPLEDLDATYEDLRRPEVERREFSIQSYYTARNTLLVVVGSLPERLTVEAIYAINRSHAISIGRMDPDGADTQPARNGSAPVASRSPTRAQLSEVA